MVKTVNNYEKWLKLKSRKKVAKIKGIKKMHENGEKR